MPVTPLVTGTSNEPMDGAHHGSAQNHRGRLIGAAGLFQSPADGSAERDQIIAGLGDARAGDGDHAFDKTLAVRKQVADLRQGRHVEHATPTSEGKPPEGISRPSRTMHEHLLRALRILRWAPLRS